MNAHQEKLGIIYSVFAYILWGFLPIYWKLIDYVPSGEILAHRIIWSFLFMIVLISFGRQWSGFISDIKRIIQDTKKLIGITVASLVISLNWLTYIWAVTHDYVIQASLGYYINPLVNILLGVVILKEKLTRGQIISVILAAIGVMNITINFGVFPWISIWLAVSFALYGLLKKTIHISAMSGLTIETMIVTPIALIYLTIIPVQSFQLDSFFSFTNSLLIGAGIATAVPLLLFASGAQKIPLATIGFLQYISPTIMLFLGVFLYQEHFSQTHFISFLFIWVALIIFFKSVYRKPLIQPIKKVDSNI